MGAAGARGRDSDCRIVVCLRHGLEPLLHILLAVLYDTDCIDPEISESKPLGDKHGNLVCLRKDIEVNRLLHTG